MSHYNVQSFYVFKELQEEHLNSIRAWLTARASDHSILGLVILGTEGLNTTLAAKNKGEIDRFIAVVSQFLSFGNLDIKYSTSDKAPFRKFIVKIRDEIVTLGKPEIVPDGVNRHLDPQAWHELLQQEDVVVIDTRNDYEYEIGTFEKAIDLQIKEFAEFPEKMKNLGTDKEKPHLIFCTGGIRCEKAIIEMENQGYKNVYQLNGGILNYMDQIPDGFFNGECFVFDSRVALDSRLQPSQKFSLCPQCGEVGSQLIQCKKCDEPTKLCKKCLAKSEQEHHYATCSKNCRYHYQRNPNKKGQQQKQFYHQ